MKKTKKKIAKNSKKEPIFKSGEVMPMLEQMSDGIEIIGEQHEEIIKRLDKHDGKLDKMQDDITEIKYKLSEKVDREEFEKLEKRVIKIERLTLSKLA